MLSNLPKTKVKESKQINETRPKTNRIKKVDCSHVLFRPVWRGWTHRLESQQGRWLHGREGANRSVNTSLNLTALTERVNIMNFSYHNARYKSWALVSVSLLALRFIATAWSCTVWDSRELTFLLIPLLGNRGEPRSSRSRCKTQPPSSHLPLMVNLKQQQKKGEKRQKPNNVKSTNIFNRSW